jgi:hypothetical protein
MFGSGLFPTERQFVNAFNLATKGDKNLLWLVKSELNYVLENQHLAGSLVKYLKHFNTAIKMAERSYKC